MYTVYCIIILLVNVGHLFRILYCKIPHSIETSFMARLSMFLTVQKVNPLLLFEASEAVSNTMPETLSLQQYRCLQKYGYPKMDGL